MNTSCGGNRLPRPRHGPRRLPAPVTAVCLDFSGRILDRPARPPSSVNHRTPGAKNGWKSRTDLRHTKREAPFGKPPQRIRRSQPRSLQPPSYTAADRFSRRFCQRSEVPIPFERIDLIERANRTAAAPSGITAPGHRQRSHTPSIAVMRYCDGVQANHLHSIALPIEDRSSTVR